MICIHDVLVQGFPRDSQDGKFECQARTVYPTSSTSKRNNPAGNSLPVLLGNRFMLFRERLNIWEVETGGGRHASALAICS